MNNCKVNVIAVCESVTPFMVMFLAHRRASYGCLAPNVSKPKRGYLVTYLSDAEPLLPSPAWIVASRLSNLRDISSIFASSSLLMVENLVFSWLRRSSTTAASSPELSPPALVGVASLAARSTEGRGFDIVDS